MRVYLYAQLVYTVATQITFRIWGVNSAIYAVVYSVSDLLIFAAMFGILDGKLRTIKAVYVSFIAGLFVSMVVLFSLPTMGYFDWINLLEGFFMASCGTCLIFEAPKTKHPMLYLALAILWLALAAFGLCYALENNSPMWKELNLWIPAALCVTAFAWIGLSERQQSIATPQPHSFPR